MARSIAACSDSGIAARIRNKLRYMGKTGYRGGYTLRQTLGLIGRLMTKGVFAGGPSRIWHFFSTLPLHRPSLIPTMMADWIAGLSMRKFAADHLWSTLTAEVRLLSSVESTLRRLLERFPEKWEPVFDQKTRQTKVKQVSDSKIRKHALAQGEVWVGRQAAGLPSLNIRLGAVPDIAFFRQGAPQLKKLLARSQTRITLALDHLALESLSVDTRKALEKLLKRLSKYGDRVVLELSEATRAKLKVDLSAFQLVLRPA